MADIELLKLLLPEFLVDYFEVEKSVKKGEELHLFFVEKNITPTGFEGVKLTSKGFFEEIIVQDFPIRGKKALLHIKRRRWLNNQTMKTVSRDWNLVAEGTRMTTEFAHFLKEISRF